MKTFSPQFGIGSIVTQATEKNHSQHAHVAPIYQTSTFSFPDVHTAVEVFEGRMKGFAYSRLDNPNAAQLARKYAILEGLDTLRAYPKSDVDDQFAGKVFGSGMAAISSAILARVKAGDTLISQQALYGNSFAFMNEIAPRLGLKVVWVDGSQVESWEKAFRENPSAILAFAETPVNPTMDIVDLKAVAEIAHAASAWLFVDNTFATPYCQRPLALEADVVLHSTTKYLAGHGTIIGGAVISHHLDYMREDIKRMIRLFGGAPSPFDAWLSNIGLKTFEIRMERHCQNAGQVAEYLSEHPKVAAVFYPGLESHPGYETATRQMSHYGGMVSFELKGGLSAGQRLMNSMHMVTLAVSLGNVDSLIEHPATMTHRSVPPDERQKAGISDGLVRFSVGIENIEDILADLEQALDRI